MTTGTEGNDNLANDTSLKHETIDALGGDDVITVTRPNMTINSGETVTVNGGSGFDTLIVDTGYSYANSLGATGFDGSFNVRVGSGLFWTVSWTSIERLELTTKFFGNNASWVLGDEIDIIRLNLGLAGGSITTGAGNDEIRVDGGGGVPFSADAGSGNDVIDMSAAGNSSFNRYVALGGTGDDVITGSSYNDRLEGGSGDDSITGNGSITAFFNDGDQFVGGEGNDILTGGSSGTDWVRYDLETGGGAVHVNLGDSQTVVGGVLLDPGTARDTFGNTDALIGIEKVSGASGDDHMLGGSGADKFEGGAGNDILTGAGGADELTGGAGMDHLDGGDGALDWVVYSRESGTGGVAVNLSASSSTVGGVLLASNTARDTFGTIDTLAGVEQVRGSEGDDFFLGGDGNDRFEGSGGNDMIEGAAGNDTLLGDSGDDYLDGGTGADLMVGASGNDVYVVDEAGDTIQDDSGIDEVRTGLISYVLPSTIENLTGLSDSGQILAGNGSSNVIRGAAGGDLLVGHGGSDQLAGGAGNDTLYGGSQEGFDDSEDWAVYDLETGGGGVRVNLSGATQELGGVLVAAGTARDSFGTIDTLYGIESARGTAGNDWLLGSSEANRLEGGGGNDLLVGGAGADAMIGGAGDDIYHVDNAGDTVTENAGEGTDHVRTSLLTYSLLSRPNVENLSATSDAAHDFRGNSGNNIVTGGAGNDILRLQDGGDDSAIGGAGNDAFLFIGSLTSADVVDGGAGSDELVLQGDYSAGLTLGAVTGVELIVLVPGSDTRFGAPGTQLYSYSIATTDQNVAAGVQMNVDGNRLRAGENLVFDGSAETDGSFYVFAGKGVDTLTGGAKNDAFLFRGPGNFTGADTVNGGAGFDELALRGDYTGAYAVTFGATTISGIEAIVVVSGYDLRYGKLAGDLSFDLTLNEANVQSGQVMIVDAGTLRSTEKLTFDGSAETDGGRFTMFGGKGGDVLTGGSGADSIRGGLGADVLKGNAGADTFVYRDTAESATGSVDQILDFLSGTDRIDLSRIDANTLVGGDQAFSWIGSNAFSGSGAAGQLRAYQDGANWFVEGDTNGDGTADLVIQLTGAATIVQGDFLP